MPVYLLNPRDTDDPVWSKSNFVGVCRVHGPSEQAARTYAGEHFDIDRLHHKTILGSTPSPWELPDVVEAVMIDEPRQTYQDGRIEITGAHFATLDEVPNLLHIESLDDLTEFKVVLSGKQRVTPDFIGGLGLGNGLAETALAAGGGRSAPKSGGLLGNGSGPPGASIRHRVLADAAELSAEATLLKDHAASIAFCIVDSGTNDPDQRELANALDTFSERLDEFCARLRHVESERNAEELGAFFGKAFLDLLEKWQAHPEGGKLVATAVGTVVVGALSLCGLPGIWAASLGLVYSGIINKAQIEELLKGSEKKS